MMLRSCTGAKRNRLPPHARKAWLHLQRRRQRSMLAWVNTSQTSSAKVRFREPRSFSQARAWRRVPPPRYVF